MCDTLILRHQGQTWFAKNSDREPAEPQRLLRLPAVRNDPEARLRTTYLDIPQAAQRHALVISQPSWIWGAEMGVNEHGVAIGNEAVFTKLTRQRGTALLGMDLLRLGLERGASAREALEVITGLLQRYGQGGPAGYRDKRIRYDNSFLIADPGEAWVLETAGNLWAAKKVERWAISNALTLGHEFDLCSRDLEDQARRQGCWDGRGDFHFARVFDTRLLPWVGGAHRRCRINQRFLDSLPGEPDWHALFAALRLALQRGESAGSMNLRLFLWFPVVQALLLTVPLIAGVYARLGSSVLFYGMSVLAIGCFVVDAMLFASMDRYARKRHEDQRAALLQGQLDACLAQCNAFVLEVEQTARMRHDVRNQAHAAMALAERGDYVRARDHISSFRSLYLPK